MQNSRIKILHIDIETAPNIAHVWGLFNQNVGLSQLVDSGYVMCFAAKWHEDDKIIFKSTYEDKMEMLYTAHQLLTEADAVVHYNGKKFDIPTLNKEFVMGGFLPPDPYHQIDLLSVARSRFRFASNKLDYVAQALNLGGKLKHRGHELWVRCMANDPEAWEEMKQYNIQDVILLEEVYNKFLPWINNHPNHALFTDEDRPVCTNCGSTHVIKKGIETTRTLQYQRYRCADCGTPLRSRYTLTDKEKRQHILRHPKTS